MSRLAIEGYASLFRIVDLSGDTVAPGAFRASLAGRAPSDVRMLYAHDPERPIGLWTQVREDAVGLFVRGEINTEVQLGREAAALLAQGALKGLSIGFNAVRAERAVGGRRLTEIDLWEISLVTFPMLPAAAARLARPDAGESTLAASLQTLTQLMRA